MNLPVNQTTATSQGVLPDAVRMLVDKIFDQLLATCPAMRAQFSDEAQLNLAKRTWVLAFAENGINTLEQVKVGMRKVRSKPDDFFPSVGKFIAWCKADQFQVWGLPNEEALYQRLVQFQAFGMGELHQFKFHSHAEFWLLTELYRETRMHTVFEVKKAIKEKLFTMVQRLERGEAIPEPKITLPKKASFTPPDVQQAINLRGVAMCKQILRGH
ncbi:replication protein P [[Pasteurella] aerogenes]